MACLSHRNADNRLICLISADNNWLKDSLSFSGLKVQHSWKYYPLSFSVSVQTLPSPMPSLASPHPCTNIHQWLWLSANGGYLLNSFGGHPSGPWVCLKAISKLSSPARCPGRPGCQWGFFFFPQTFGCHVFKQWPQWALQRRIPSLSASSQDFEKSRTLMKNGIIFSHPFYFRCSLCFAVEFSVLVGAWLPPLGRCTVRWPW